MQYQADSDLAMILPLPTPPSPSENAVRFINLSRYSQFFHDMSKGFFTPPTKARFTSDVFNTTSTLMIHEVGSFQASFVPRLQDFDRLDSRFRLPEQTWKQLPQYNDYAFVVFKLKAGAKNVHPMAFEFPRRNPQDLFFPTVHVHDSTVETKAYFDHSLYFQTAQIQTGVRFSTADGLRPKPAKQFINIAKTQGIVDADMVIQNQQIQGIDTNRDIVIGEEI
jgi:hypothetical protein